MSDQEFRKTPDTDELKAKLSKFLSEKEELEEKLEIDELNTFEDEYHKTVDAIASSANPKKKKNYEEKLEKLKALEKIRNECESLQATIKAIESQPENYRITFEFESSRWRGYRNKDGLSAVAKIPAQAGIFVCYE